MKIFSLKIVFLIYKVNWKLCLSRMSSERGPQVLTWSFNHFRGAFISMSVVEGLKIQIHVCGTYVLSVWFTLLIGFGSVWIFSRFVPYVTAATHFSFFWTIWWVNRLLYPSTRVIYYLYCSYRQRPLTVQLKMEYSIIPLVHLSLELQPLLQLASSDVNLTCGVINKFSIRSFNSWVPLGLGLWLKWGRPAGTRMIIQSLQRCFH